MLKIHRPARKQPNGKVIVAPRPGMRHVEIAPAGERGFVTSDGDFVGREEGAKIAIAAGQVPDTVSRLHSEDLPEYKKLHRKK
jgi:hypothetical protein